MSSAASRSFFLVTQLAVVCEFFFEVLWITLTLQVTCCLCTLVPSPISPNALTRPKHLDKPKNMHNTKTKSMLLPKHHQVRHDWVLVPIVTLEAIFPCAAVPGGNPHPRRVGKLNWTAEVWNVSSGVTGCLGALDDITVQSEIEKLKEETRQCEGDPRN